MTTFVATIRLNNNLRQQIRVQADSQAAARAIIEAMYGQGNILIGPWRAAG